MIEQAKSAEQLRSEILHLQKKNKELSAQLAIHRRVFQEVHSALGVASDLNESFTKQEAVSQLLEENERLKNQLMLFRLTDREKEILALIVKGLTSKEIAGQLNISKLTVDTHRKHIQQKLEISNTVELIKLALQFDLA
ncbi:MAG: hypothetical protein H6577_12565 [Lewinellaceae bacterium]|nr:hypothetical protein [Saprospiraceae bacterium]MCB9338954.1 hypothetical protein [Lewinellaceae bacterium]